MDMDFGLSCALVRPQRLVSSFCSSARTCDTRFFQTSPHGDALAFLSPSPPSGWQRDLHLPSTGTCPAHMNHPAASCEVSNPRLHTAMAPPVWRGGCSCILWTSCMRTLEQSQLDVLAMQLRIAFFTALLPHILANDFFIAVTAYGTDEIAFGPKLSTPQTLFDGRDAVKALTRRETFDDLDNLGRAVARHRLHQKMDMILVGTDF